MELNQEKIIFVETADGPQEITLQPQHFSIDPGELDRELCQMGKLLIYYGEIETALRMEVERKEAALEKFEADFDSHVRFEHKAKNEKVTEKVVEAAVVSSEARQRLLESLRFSRSNHGMARWAMKALEAKKDCLIAMSYRERELIKAERFGGLS